MFISIISKLNAQAIYEGDAHTAPYVFIGDVEPMNFEQAFRKFQAITQEDCDWLQEIGYTGPSMSVGDIVTLGSETKQVASVGFVDLDPPDPCGYCRRCAIHDDPGGCLEVYDWELRTMGIREEQS